jgi:Holliday junction resolvasome RuvABC DNA-binding subunit
MTPRSPTNAAIADRLDEVATLLAEQGANPFRVRAYKRGAETLRTTPREVAALFAAGGLEALTALPGIGEGLARSIQELLVHGRLAQLDRLRGEADPVALLRTVPGVGPALAARIHDTLHCHTLEELEVTAHDGRLARLPGLGPRRLASIRDTLAQRLARVRVPAGVSPAPARASGGEPPVAELLDVDAEYRRQAAAGKLPTIAPRRFNPGHEAWLPVLHTRRGSRHYTALYSNTALAHKAGRTHDWVVLYVDGGRGERTYTVVTAPAGPLKGRRVVRGREAEMTS